ncbi:MAG: BrnA antitoxin family protein [Halothiobacillaceae bacterium]|nr:BrnA antitoxin family protein [Halothiobacillaceae bacterium]
MNANNNAMPTGWTDLDDAPELTDAFFEQADEFDGERLVKRGRPRVEARKVQLTVRYDAEVVEAFRATGKGWQGRMNEALKDWLKQRAA